MVSGTTASVLILNCSSYYFAVSYHWFDDYPTHLSLLTDGRVLVSGGFLSDIGPLSSSELYDPAIGTWTTTGPMKKARGWPTMTLLQNGQVLVEEGSCP